MYYLSNLLVVFPAGRLMDRVGRAPVLALGHAAGACGAASVALSLGAQVGGGPLVLASFLGGLFCVGAGWCLTYIPGSAILADATSFEERGTLFGTNDAVVSLFGATMTILAGFLYAGWGVLGLAFLGLGCGALPFAAAFAL